VWAPRTEVTYLSAGPDGRVTGPHPRLPPDPQAREWLLSWYPVQHLSRALVGPPADKVAPVIERSAYQDAVRRYLKALPDRLSHGPDGYARGVTVACRASYVLRFGHYGPYVPAGRWARRRFPDWSTLIRDVVIRQEPRPDPHEALAFLDAVAEQAEARAGP
jgi:hypothetical protein